MKVMLINGSPHEKGCTYTALAEAAKSLAGHGIETEFLWLGRKAVPGCIVCGGCSNVPLCMFDDAVNDILENVDDIDGLIVGSPVYYSAPSGQLISFLDRLFYASRGKLAGKPAAAVVSCRRGGATAAFQQLNQFFLMNNMPVVPSNYWNQVHGSSPEEVLQDEEGLQTMRTLGENMAWLLHSIAANPAKPQYEPKVWTNFIR